MTTQPETPPGGERMQTHHAECWLDRRHHACAVAKVRALQSKLDEAREQQSAWEKEWHKEVVKSEEMRKRIKQFEQDVEISEGVCEELQAELNTIKAQASDSTELAQVNRELRGANLQFSAENSYQRARIAELEKERDDARELHQTLWNATHTEWKDMVARIEKLEGVIRDATTAPDYTNPESIVRKLREALPNDG